MDDEYKIIDFEEMKVPFNIIIDDKEVTHTFINGTVGTGMSSYAAVIDSYIRNGPYKVKWWKNEIN